MDQISDFSVVPLSQSRFVRPYRIEFKQNGVPRIWDAIEVHESVSIICFNKSRNVLILVRQFRPAVFVSSARSQQPGQSTAEIDFTRCSAEGGITYELCAGIVDKETSLQEIAQVEMLEECGFQVPLQAIERVTSFRSGVGVAGDRQHMFYVEVTDEMRIGPGGGNPSEGELIDVVEVPLGDVERFILDETVLRPSGMMFGLLWFVHYKIPQMKL